MMSGTKKDKNMTTHDKGTQYIYIYIYIYIYVCE